MAVLAHPSLRPAALDSNCQRKREQKKKKFTIHPGAHSQVHAHPPFTHKGGIGHRGNDDRDTLMCANDAVITPTSANGAKD